MSFADHDVCQPGIGPPVSQYKTSNLNFLALARANADIFWTLTPTGQMWEATADWCLFTGQLAKDSFGQGWLNAFHPSERGLFVEMLHQASISGLPGEQRCRLRGADGSYHLVHLHCIPMPAEDGDLDQLVVSGRELSGQNGEIVALRRAKEEANEAHQRLRTILSSITDGFAHIDAEWRYTYVNQRVEEFARKRKEELLGLTLWEASTLFTPFEREIREAVAAQKSIRLEIFVPQTQRWVEIHMYPAGDGLSIYGQDITERKLLEEQLRESELRLRRLVDANIIGMTIDNLNGEILEANDAFLSIVEYTREDLEAGRVNWVAMLPPGNPEKRLRKLEEIRTTGNLTPFEGEYVTKTGQRVPALIGGTLFRKEGSACLMIRFVVDLRAQKALERQKEFFLGMTSHELKTPLAALKATLQLAQRRVKRVATGEQEVPEWNAFLFDLNRQLTTAIHQIDIQNRLINDLLDISRIATNTLELTPCLCDLVPLVKDTIKNLRIVVPERVLTLELPAHTSVLVMVDTERICQVLTNYVTNALRYAPPEQPIEIGLTLQEKSARVWVRDYGPGLSEEAQKQIWQRFHQIKGTHPQGGLGKGLGLGLYICQMLIAQHQGEVGVDSIHGQGATFWFRLPLAQ